MTDWLMVIITFVYVVATIFICVFNYRSAKAAKEQIELSKLQYEDDVRLKLMPCLIVKCIEPAAKVDGMIDYEFKSQQPQKLVDGKLYLEITNVGNGIAKEVSYIMHPGANGYRRYTATSMPVNDSRKVCFSFSAQSETKQELNICVFYLDLLDHEYTQELSIYLDCLDNEIRTETITMTAPKYRNNTDRDKYE